MHGASGHGAARTTAPYLDALIRALQSPSAYAHRAGDVEVIHTHASVVFLAGDFAYKVKKPVDLGFLDFTTLERRRHFCHEEVRLNRRLARDVYLGVVPITAREERHPSEGAGGSPRALRVGGEGAVVEYAVKMRRLPAHATMLELVRRGRLTHRMTERVAERIARFHDAAGRGPEVSAFGSWRTVARNALENLRQTRSHVGRTVSPEVFERASRLTRDALRRYRPTIEARCLRGVPRDAHGDLHLDHVYFLPDRSPPDDLVVIDCIEFNRRFRFADPIADVAFLAMDLTFRDRRDAARALLEGYFRVRRDQEGEDLVAFYISYRSLVRAKVRGLTAGDASVPLRARRDAVHEARGHWLLALGELETAGRRPGLVLVGGLPGSGKSTLASGLAKEAGFVVVASDRVRKRLAGLDELAPATASFGEGLYTESWTRRTYAACFREAARHLCLGRRVVVDATFREELWRERFLDLARRLGVRHVLLRCSAEPDVIRRRMERRRPGPSDADWEIHLAAAGRWETLSERAAERTRNVDVGGTPSQSVARALEELSRIGLAGATAG